MGFGLLAAQTALAADTDGNFAIKGAGLQNCEAFRTAYKDGTDDLRLYAGWLDGYQTALNQFVPDVFDIAPWQSTRVMLALTDSACSQVKPDTRFMDAFATVIRIQKSGALTQKGPATGLSRDGVAMVIYQEILVRVQKALATAGFKPGNTDGVFDNASADALVAYQKANDLKVTGLPDQATLFKLIGS